MLDGMIEVLTPYFAIGWAAHGPHGPVHLVAEYEDMFLGSGRADIARPDLARMAQPLSAFIITFGAPLPAERLADVKVRIWNQAEAFPATRAVRLETRAPLQLFILGSPRSGTSELGATLSKQLDLPWLGEGHAAPSFAQAAAAIAGDIASPNGLLRFMADHALAERVHIAAREAYYFAHGSASFLDKTPGVEMIRAAVFLQACFPDARFLFLRRNGIANVMSRRAKFGGDFERHCQDWAAAMTDWQKTRSHIQHYLEVEQEAMMATPDDVAARIATFVGLPEAAGGIGVALKAGTLERTGAGLGKTRFADTGWTPVEIALFQRHCGEVMKAWGYAMA